mgnify:CR=1 FL=1
MSDRMAIVAGNWKMNTTKSEASALASAVADKDGKATTPVILPTDYTGEHTLAMVGVSPKETVRTLTSKIDIVACMRPTLE